MKRKLLTLLLPAIISSSGIKGQTYYHLTYASASNNNSIEDAFLALYDNGTGFVRINLTGSDGKKTLYESELNEEFVFTPEGSVDTTKFLYIPGKPKLKSGTGSTKWKEMNYWFRLDATKNSMSPWIVTENKDSSGGRLFERAEIVEPSQLSEPAYLLNYFLKDEPFYKNRVGPRSRGGKLNPEEKDTRLLLLVVASTYDRKIGPDVKKDAVNVVETFENVAAFLGIRSVVDTVLGENFGRTNVLNAVNKLNPRSKDIVVFWFSGHGFSDIKNPDPRKRKMLYPFLDLRDPRQRPRPEVKDSTMNIQEIYELIKKKGGRFNLVVSDCCNDEMEPPMENDMPKTSGPKGIPPKWNWDNVYTLFMKPRTSLLTTAASQGQRARGDEVNGGVYTKAFLGTLVSNMLPDKSNPVWTQILAKAQMETKRKIESAKLPCPLPFQPKNICQQVPPVPRIN